MQITFEIDITDDKAGLIAAMECAEADLEAVITKHAKAALHEYLECYVGRRAFSRGNDILEHRLALLIEHAFDRTIPTAARVSNLFQTTLSTSRTLIRNTFSKYRFQLVTVEAVSAKTVLENVEWNGQDSCFAKITTPNLVEVLNRRLLASDPSLKEVSRVPGVVGTYSIGQDSYAVLCGIFAAQPKEKPQP